MRQDGVVDAGGEFDEGGENFAPDDQARRRPPLGPPEDWPTNRLPRDNAGGEQYRQPARRPRSERPTGAADRYSAGRYRRPSGRRDQDDPRSGRIDPRGRGDDRRAGLGAYRDPARQQPDDRRPDDRGPDDSSAQQRPPARRRSPEQWDDARRFEGSEPYPDQGRYDGDAHDSDRYDSDRYDSDSPDSDEYNDVGYAGTRYGGGGDSADDESRAARGYPDRRPSPDTPPARRAPERRGPERRGPEPGYPERRPPDRGDANRSYPDHGSPAGTRTPGPVRRPGGRVPQDRGRHLPPYSEPELNEGSSAPGPRKLTVTRIAALRSKELTTRGVELFRRAASADGADQSGLTHLTYAVMANYAVDAALTVALANTLFFAAAAGESTAKVLLYLLITVAPFAVIAPFIGPLLDRVQNGRRIALAVCSFGRSLLAIIMAFNFDSWLLYPCALGMMVLSKSFGVLKAALTPRVLPRQITLVKTNSRLTVFGLMAGAVAGAIAAAFAAMSGSSGALIWTALCGIAGGILCLRIPAWVESTAGEVPVQHSEILQRGKVRRFPPTVSATLWVNLANRIETGFLALFIAFVVKTEYAHASGLNQLLLLGIVGAAAGIGGFLGNGLGAKMSLQKPDLVAGVAVGCVALTTFVTMLVPGLAMGAVVGLVGSTASSLAKVCLDSVIQDELPEASRASAFGVSESALQLAWVFGGVVGLLLGGVLHLRGNPVYTLGFGVVTALVVLALVQAWLARSGRSLLPMVDALLTRRRARSPADPAGVSGESARPAVTRGSHDPRQHPPTIPLSDHSSAAAASPQRPRSAAASPRRGIGIRKAGGPR